MTVVLPDEYPERTFKSPSLTIPPSEFVKKPTISEGSIYDTDGILTGDRVLDGEQHSLTFDKLSEFNILADTGADVFVFDFSNSVWGFGVPGGSIYCDRALATTKRLSLEIVKLPFGPDNLFVGSHVFNIANFTENAFSGVLLDTASNTQVARLYSTDGGGDGHVVEASPSRVTVARQTSNPVIFSFTSAGAPTLPAFADDAAATVGGLVRGDLYQADGSGVNILGTIMIKQ